VEFGDFDVDVPISGHMAFFRYNDRPGVVGVVGRLLGDASVNIAGMQVSRDKDADNALIVLTVDSEIPAATVEQIKTEIGAHSGRVANLSL
jgi:D-3-phosphoglycerate dehydrogenase